ncbi:GNAT family N-acetyltransferase [Metapseudomonas otitidis]|uniref:L-methionine sulfoximine/L-methionine sulfone acetyltransferase n=1 Tax=Metapseudomonas otitidis TaxID=319939 RepID=A0A6S5RN32_9GAMM|nr:GNAT family N-acetyltransferase [Pseudomonas otitidis]WIF68242.1 N-acetyltransferase family protein [Pseudomonas otitidis]BBT14654.1 L-methionine sulfoximine/L-methionine sulfone acetyltransferase [Pseudomonas otitidis]
MPYVIHDARDADLPGILAIYNDAVAHTTAIWNETQVDLANRQAWLAERRAAGFPVLAAVSPAGDVLGYATYGTWRSIEGFRHTVEHSVYVREGLRGQGIGRHLLETLVHRAQEAGLHVMVAAIETQNSASIHLHQRLGFVVTGQMPQVGRKFGRWLDLTFMQRQLDETP